MGRNSGACEERSLRRKEMRWRASFLCRPPVPGACWARQAGCTARRSDPVSSAMTRSLVLLRRPAVPARFKRNASRRRPQWRATCGGAAHHSPHLRPAQGGRVAMLTAYPRRARAAATMCARAGRVSGFTKWPRDSRNRRKRGGVAKAALLRSGGPGLSWDKTRDYHRHPCRAQADIGNRAGRPRQRDRFFFTDIWRGGAVLDRAIRIGVRGWHAGSMRKRSCGPADGTGRKR